ncbi:UNVERIFIED_CONTAM: hypothetical protein DES50_1079 [Williamsia faeni]
MSKHRAPRVRTPRWSAFVGAIALTIGGIALLLTDTSASAHCSSASAQCGHHSSPTQTTKTGQYDYGDPEDPETPTTSSTTTRTRVPAPTYNPAPADGAGATSSGESLPKTATRPPGDLPTQKTPTTSDNPDDAGLAPVLPPSDSGTGGGSTGGGGAAVESVPTVEPATSNPAPAAGARQNQQPPVVNIAPAIIAIDPVSNPSQCLLGSGDNGGCFGADTARDLAPGGLLVLGALALLGSGSFLESLRGSLRS